MNAYDSKWPVRLRGPYETADGVRFVVQPNRTGVAVVCPLCATHVHPGSLVAEVAGSADPVCMECRPTGGSRIRAGRKPRAEAPRFLGLVMDGAAAWSMGAGRARIFQKGTVPLHAYCIGQLTRRAGLWQGALVVPTVVGAVNFLLPIKIGGMTNLQRLPGSAYFRELEQNLLRLRLKDPPRFARQQLVARMRLLAWNEGKIHE